MSAYPSSSLKCVLKVIGTDSHLPASNFLNLSPTHFIILLAVIPGYYNEDILLRLIRRLRIWFMGSDNLLKARIIAA